MIVQRMMSPIRKTAKAPKAVKQLYSTEELLEMPDDGVERWLIDG